MEWIRLVRKAERGGAWGQGVSDADTRSYRRGADSIMSSKTIRVITRATDGSVRTRDFDSCEALHQIYEQVGSDDCSTDLSLRGMPVFRGLVGPIPDGKQVARYESPEVFESITKEWSRVKSRRRRRTQPADMPVAADCATA